MFIHWFPGHMTKSIRMMEKEISLVECVLYVLDSRAPMSSINPAFDSIIGNKPVLYVLNKCDMVTQKDINVWKTYFESTGKSVITSNSVSKNNGAAVIRMMKELNKETIDRYSARGVRKTIRAMVIGVPNTGKSTLINSLIQKKKAITGNRPGVTRGKQWITIDPYIDLLDTPGTLYPDFTNQLKATNLAIVGSIKEDILDIVELSMEIIKFLAKSHKKELLSIYPDLTIIDDQLQENAHLLELLKEIGRKRGLIMKGNEVDLSRTAKSIITDFRKQKFGNITLEKIEDIALYSINS